MTKNTGLTPAMLLAAAQGHGLMAGSPGAIEASEAAGQQDLVNSEMLPKETAYGPSLEDAAKAWGMTIGEDVDDLFVNVTLPKGWQKVASNHSMHSDLVDDKSRARAGIFYKAAFYDRRADIHFMKFYQIETEYGEYPSGKVGLKNANGEWVIPLSETDKTIDREKEIQDRLSATNPDWRNPFAYWD